MTETHPPLHVIVGATSPIARAYAVVCAAAGKSLLLAGRDLSELELISADLKIRHAVSVAVERYDASLPGEGRRLALAFSGRPVGAVVAFHGIMGDRYDFAAMLQVNCASIAELFEAVADQSVQAGGKPVLAAVSSVAGDRGRQSNYPYGASKAALDAYLSGLRNRLHPLGLRVVTIKPGFVRTRLTEGKVNPRSPLLAEPAQVATDIRRAIEGSADVVYTLWFWRPIMAIIRSIPEFVFKRLKL
jgi:decaprenylphospho-beta-D-erythro-pentofuranosid-2-ulose 2-reductase